MTILIPTQNLMGNPTVVSIFPYDWLIGYLFRVEVGQRNMKLCFLGSPPGTDIYSNLLDSSKGYNNSQLKIQELEFQRKMNDSTEILK